MSDLYGNQQAQRASAAWRLGAYVIDPKYGSQAVGSLISALGFENDHQVQIAILRAVEPAGRQAHPLLLEARKAIDGEIANHFSIIDPQTGLPTKEAENTIHNRQQAMIKISLALASKAHCLTASCAPDFSNLISLRRAKFFSYADRLKRANFSGTSLSGADFFEIDLTGARFERSQLESAVFVNANLANARFDGATMRHLTHRIQGPQKRTKFRNANLAGASFVDTCLSGADLRESRNLDIEALARAYTEGVLIEPDKLHALGILRSDRRCSPVQE